MTEDQIEAHRNSVAAERDRLDKRTKILTGVKNSVYRTLVSLVAAVAQAAGSPMDAVAMIEAELANVRKDLERAHNKAKKREAGK